MLIILLIVFFSSKGKEKTPERAPADLAEESVPPDQEIEKKNFVLFFVSEKNYLLCKEEREIPLESTIEHQIERLIEELVLGSEEGLLSPLPKETKVRAVYITKNGIAYVDFSPEFQTKHPSGSSAEISSIFSVVNSVTYNFRSIKRVFILINGTEQETLAGHVDLRKPFLPRYDLMSD